MLKQVQHDERRETPPPFVIPAKAGTHEDARLAAEAHRRPWVPTSVGMTKEMKGLRSIAQTRWEPERPDEKSLWLLPSGPDQVGDDAVRPTPGRADKGEGPGWQGCIPAANVGTMTSRTASCACGQLNLRCEGEPVRVSVCHCLDCQRRSGSAFAAQARFPDAHVAVSGEWREWERIGDAGGRARFRFCPACGSTICYMVDADPGMTAIPVGAFADPAFPSPVYSVYEGRRHRWLAIVGDGIDRFD
jgi:hypothetical protein